MKRLTLALLAALLLSSLLATPLLAHEGTAVDIQQDDDGNGDDDDDGDSTSYYTVQSGDYWARIASLVGVSTSELRAANPGKIRYNGVLYIGERLVVPVTQDNDRDGDGDVDAPRYHIVQAGEYWGGIAEQYGISTRLLQATNPRLIRADLVLLSGDRILLPPEAEREGEESEEEAADEEASDEEEADEEEADAEEVVDITEADAEEADAEEADAEEVGDGGDVEISEADAAEADAAEPARDEPLYHTVEYGEYWGGIAELYDVSVRELWAANPGKIRANYVLYRGEEILVPLDVEEADEAEASEESKTETVDIEDAEAEVDAEVEAEVEVEVEAEIEVDVDETEAQTTTEVVSATVIDTETQIVTETVVVTETRAVTDGDTEIGTEAETETETEVEADDATTDEATVAEPSEPAEPTTFACPGTVAAMADSLLNALDGLAGTAVATDAAAVESYVIDYLTHCGALLDPAQVEVSANTLDQSVVAADWTGDGMPDVAATYGFTQAADGVYRSDVALLNSGAENGENGYSLGYQARAAGQVVLLATGDVNNDEQPDVAWIDTTCGASTCFNTVEIRSWDDGTWRDLTQGTITMAFADIALEDIDNRTPDQELTLVGGIHGSFGAGPQRETTEVWESVDGAPYALVSISYAESDCLYHTVLDANRAFVQSPGAGFERADTLYTEALTNDELGACWTRADEIAELRSFSLFRRALIAGYQGQPDAASAFIVDLSEAYPDGIYATVGRRWLDVYLNTRGDVIAACANVNDFAAENPLAYEILADYGYTNPTFRPQDVCPILDIEIPDVNGEVDGETTRPEALAQAEPVSETISGTEIISAADEIEADGVDAEALAAVALPACPDTISGFGDVITDVVTLTEGDAETVETWLRACDGLNDARGAVVRDDFNGDGADDLLMMPVIVSDLGIGQNGEQGALHLWNGVAEGGSAEGDGAEGAEAFARADTPALLGGLALISTDDLNADGTREITLVMEGCTTFCTTRVHVLSPLSDDDGDAYVSNIEAGAVIFEGVVGLEGVPEGEPGAGQQIVLEGGVSGTPEGGVAVPHRELWRSVTAGDNAAPYQRIAWRYDREIEGNSCLGLRLVEADVALNAAPVIGYEQALIDYGDALLASTGDDATLGACSIYGLEAAEEIALLRGLASFRLAQAQALSGDPEAASATLDALTAEQPESDYSAIATAWLDSYAEAGDAAAACEAVQPVIDGNDSLWQVTDQFGINHPALAAEQICYVP